MPQPRGITWRQSSTRQMSKSARNLCASRFCKHYLEEIPQEIPQEIIAESFTFNKKMYWQWIHFVFDVFFSLEVVKLQSWPFDRLVTRDFCETHRGILRLKNRMLPLENGASLTPKRCLTTVKPGCERSMMVPMFIARDFQMLNFSYLLWDCDAQFHLNNLWSE